MSWHELFMRHVYLIALKSKDPRTKIGAVLVKNNSIFSEGYNGFPRKVKDELSRYENRELKQIFVCHAETNSILNAARLGVSTEGATLYTQGIPCHNCAKSIINAGIKDIYIHSQWPDMESSAWKESVGYASVMFQEADIPIYAVSQTLNLEGFNDGKVFNV